MVTIREENYLNVGKGLTGPGAAKAKIEHSNESSSKQEVKIICSSTRKQREAEMPLMANYKPNCKQWKHF
jgi:hypothetical protein